MFSLIWGFFSYLFKQSEYHVLMLGVDNAGKTTLLEKLKFVYSNIEGLPVEKITPTVGLNIGRITCEGSKLTIWDVGGQMSLRSIWNRYYADAHAILFVVDSSNRARFAEAKEALHGILKHPDLANAPVFIFGNKQDLEAATNIKEIMDYMRMPSLEHRHVESFSISALKGTGIEPGMSSLAKHLQLHARKVESDAKS